mmetsp:Transcript_12549/g.21785  ORF Transcript_12549/g.21785 Transcript_12549/m.21785 type:complete len:134 (-) Transcript_12549:254-655(-)
MPGVKAFVKQPGGADTYDCLRVNYVPGHKPTLIVDHADGKGQDEFQFTREMSTEDCHKMIQEKGFSKKATTVGSEDVGVYNGEYMPFEQYMEVSGQADLYKRYPGGLPAYKEDNIEKHRTSEGHWKAPDKVEL